MKWLRESISIAAAVFLLIVFLQLINQGAVSMINVGAALAVAFIAAIVGVLKWGFGERIERFLKERRKPEKPKDALSNDGKTRQKEELDLLIKPLYLAFEKYPSNKLVDMLSYPAEMWKSVLVSGTFGDAQNKNFPGAEDTVNLVVDIMLQHRDLAAPKLQETIDQYLAMRRARREREGQYAVNWHPYFEDAEKVINEIVALVRERYDVLTGKRM